MKNHPLIPLIAALTALSANAEPLTFDFKDPKGVNNIVFKLDAPLESINGTASGISGTVTLDPAQPDSAKGRIVVASDSLRVPNPIMNSHLHGGDWIDSKQFPEISFEISKLSNLKRAGDSGTADVVGNFTLHGITKEMTVPVKVTYLPGKLKARGGDVEGDLLVVRSTFQIKRSEFGIQPGKNSDKVAEDIEITLSLAGASPKK